MESYVETPFYMLLWWSMESYAGLNLIDTSAIKEMKIDVLKKIIVVKEGHTPKRKCKDIIFYICGDIVWHLAIANKQSEGTFPSNPSIFLVLV